MFVVMNKTTVANRQLGPSRMISAVRFNGGMWRTVQERSIWVWEYHESRPREKKVRVEVHRNGISFLGVNFIYLGP